ncbi:MAG: helix-turn-helix domain-containing protein [Acetatifactor sp.]|nr:helix-turn-helix domain-containing protein [Acetatifactor sp.]
MMNPRELDVLNILWKSEEPMMATDIVNEGEGLTQSTVTAVLRKLLHAKLVEVVGVTHSGKVLSRTYRPTPESRDIILKDFTDNYSSFRDVIPKSSLFAALLKTDGNTQEMQKDIAELKSMIKEYEQKYIKKK